MSRSTSSIRSRLASWYAAALALMLVIYAGASYLLVRHALFGQIDELLEDDLYAASGAIRLGEDGRVSWRPSADSDSTASDDRGEDAWLPGGDVIHRSGISAAWPLPASSDKTRSDLVDATGAHWRTRVGTVSIGPQTAIVRVARSTEQVRDDLLELGVVLVAGIPVMLLVAAASGYGLAGRLLRPIDQLARDAERITADRLHERLRTPNPDDEIGRLTAVINGAFARIGFAFEQLRRFTADASHELRTPLAVVRGIGESALGQPRTAPEYQDAIGSILEENDRMTGLVNALLRLTSADAGAVSVRAVDVELGALVRDVAASLAILAEEKQQRLVVSGDDVHVHADPLLVREAVMNIVHNAVKYSPPGSVTRIDLSRDGSHGVVTVCDQGPGIEPRDRERVFDRFFRVDQARSRDGGGSGLGLAIAKWAVEANDGTITVDGAPGTGACFRIALPRSRAETAGANQHPGIPGHQ